MYGAEIFLTDCIVRFVQSFDPDMSGQVLQISGKCEIQQIEFVSKVERELDLDAQLVSHGLKL